MKSQVIFWSHQQSNHHPFNIYAYVTTQHTPFCIALGHLDTCLIFRRSGGGGDGDGDGSAIIFLSSSTTKVLN